MEQMLLYLRRHSYHQGHIDMTVGDLTLADGSVSITDEDNAASLTV